MRTNRPIVRPTDWLLLVCALAVQPFWAGPADAHGAPAPPPIGAASAPWSGPRSTLEADVLADAADGVWNRHSLLAAALVAGGIDDTRRLAEYQRRFAQWVEQLRRPRPVAGSDRGRAQAVFEFMHRRILRGGYRIDATDLATTLDEGRFNCVSASIVFCCLAEQFGLNVRGLEAPGHAMCRLVLEGETVDVETTAPTWFRLIDDPRRRAEVLQKTTGLRPGDVPSAFREVSAVELIATIYYNRGVDLLGEKQFAEAAAANAKALRLDPASRTAWGNLLATVNNWAIDEGMAGRYVEAADLLRAGFQLDPSFRSFTVNYLYVHRQWIDALCRGGRFTEAIGVLAQAAGDRPNEPWFAQAAAEIQRRWTQP